MARGRKRKTDKCNFTEEQMKVAVNMVINDIFLRQAGERTGIKFQTVHRYVKEQKNARENAHIRLTPNYACRQIFKDSRELAYEVAVAKDLNASIMAHQ